MAGSWAPYEVRAVIEMASDGLGAEVIALEVKRSMADVRELAESLGLPLEALEYPLVCPRCAHGYVIGDADWCPACEREIKQHRMDEAIAEEVRRAEEVEREDARIRKQNQRFREKYGTNPRKGKRKQ